LVLDCSMGGAASGGHSGFSIYALEADA